MKGCVTLMTVRQLRRRLFRIVNPQWKAIVVDLGTKEKIDTAIMGPLRAKLTPYNILLTLPVYIEENPEEKAVALTEEGTNVLLVKKGWMR